jgi:hypothetical protein
MAHFLTVAEVLTRYQLRDRRSARRVMDQAGSFKVAGRLLVSEADLETWETRQKERRIENAQPPGDASTRRSRRASGIRETDRAWPEPLLPEWWKNERA